MQSVAPWTSIPSSGVSYRLNVSTAVPVTMESPHAMEVTSTGAGAGAMVGVSNPGFWGISLVNHTSFSVSLWAYSSSITSVTASLTSMDHSTTYATTTLTGIAKTWTHLNSTLTLKAPSDDAMAVFTLTWTSTSASDTLFLDVVTLFPTVGWRGLPYIRSDLAELIEAIHPSIVRLPGGSYIDGVSIAGRFEWNTTVGPLEHRPGHANLWGYWSEDGLGIYEYFSWAEKLTDVYGDAPRVVWVVNSGISYGGEVITPEQLNSSVQDAINSVEFATGATDTKWGAMREAMGHPAPFRLDYLAIGNENCQGPGAPTYLKYYPVFYQRLKAAYPHLQLISNCNEAGLGAFDLYDWHTYPAPQQLYGMGHTFDRYNLSQKIFVSEYAAKGGTAGNGTLDGALAEAVFMNGMEVNSQVIKLASYAPLFANVNNLAWIPDAIYFDSSRSYGTPSYWTQVLYANSYQGLRGPPMTLQFSDGAATGFSTSVVVGNLTSEYGRSKGGADTVYVLKMVNTGASNSTVSISLQGLPSSATFPAPSDWALLQSPTSSRTDLNTFGHEMQVAPVYAMVSGASSSFNVSLPAYSTSVLRVYVKMMASGKRAGRVQRRAERVHME